MKGTVEIQKPLEDLTESEVHRLLELLNLTKYIEVFKQNEVDGHTLQNCRSEEDVKKLGITMTAKARVLLNEIEKRRSSESSVEQIDGSKPNKSDKIQLKPIDDEDNDTMSDNTKPIQYRSAKHTEVLSSTTTDQVTLSSSSEGHMSSTDDDDVIERLIKEMQSQSPSIYTSVKNLIAYLVGNELSLGTYSSPQDIMLFGKCLLQAIQAHELLSYGDFILQHPQREGESGAKKADGKISRLFGKSFFLWSRCWLQIKASTIELIQAMNTVDVDEVEIFLSVYEKTLSDTVATATGATGTGATEQEEEELIWAENFSEVLRNRQRLRSQLVAGRIADKAEEEEDDHQLDHDHDG